MRIIAFITDPPYYDEVPYLELSRLWCAWLDLPYNHDLLEQEIVVSDSPERTKDFERYRADLKEAIEEITRVLKAGKYCSIWFHNRNLKVWNLLINEVISSGLRVANVVYQPHSLISFKQAKDKSGTVRGHFILNCVKPPRRERFPLTVDESANKAMVKAAQREIVERGGATLSEIYAALIPVLVELGALDVMASMSSDLEAFLQENFEKKGNKWYVREKDFGTLDAHIPLRTRLHLFIPSIINRLDKEKKEFSIDDIFQNLLPLLVNGKTPDKHEIVTVLERYAKETPTGGNWQRRRDTKQIDIFEASRKAAQILPELPLTDDHNQVLKILGTLGQYAGCSVHIGKKERRQDAELAELSIDNLAIHGLPSQALRIVEQIDVLWLRDGTVVSAFEVEGSTPVYSGLARFDDLVKLVPNIRIKAYIVFPPSREGVVRLQFGRLAFQELARREGWKFITYEQLFDFFETIRGQRIKIRPESLDEIAVNPFET